MQSSLKDHDYEKSNEKKQPKEINLKEVFDVLKRYVWIIVLSTMVTTSIGTFYTVNSYTPIYQSATRIIIGGDSQLMSTLLVIIRDTVVLDKVVKKLDLPYSAEALSTKISASSVDGSQVVTIAVVDSNPDLAATIANTTAETYKEEIPGILDFDDVKLLSPAKVNPVPINENNNQGIIFSIIGGLIVGIGITFLLDSLNNSVRKEDEVENLLGIPVLGSVSKMNRNNMQRKKKKQNSVTYRGETIGS